MRRVVVTGLGAVTPIGADAPSTWRAAVAGESGIDWITAFDASDFPVRVAAEVKDFDATQVAPPKEARRLDRNVLLALAAAGEAVADAVLAGASEACLTPLILAGCCAMRGLAAEEEHPPRASRPFDATRAGFVMGEGACILVLEELEAAQRRGATIYAEVLGYAMSNDAHHLAQPDPDSTGVAEMMRRALERAGVEPERVGYINAHGTSTPLGDAAETRAIKTVFGGHAYRLAVSSTKSVTGHCFGAAGAVEAMMCVLAVRDGVLPPTMNYVDPDPECDLDYVPNEARRVQVDIALSNAMGLGGHNGCVLIGRI